MNPDQAAAEALPCIGCRPRGHHAKDCPAFYCPVVAKLLADKAERLEWTQASWRETCEAFFKAIARAAELEAALREIANQVWLENVLDPQWAARIARTALAAGKEPQHGPDL